MDFGISTRCFGTAKLTAGSLERLRRAEFPLIELHASLPGFDYRNRSVQREITQWFRENEIDSLCLHLPFEENVLAPRAVERQHALDEIKRCLEFTDLLPPRHVVLHLGTAGEQFSPVFFEYMYAALSVIQSFSGLRVLIETLENSIATFDRIEEFKAASQIANVGICYDTGHGEMTGAADAIHLNDNTGTNDDHLWPFEGTRDWPAFIGQLVQSSFNGPMILEGRDENFERALSARSRLRDLRDEALNSIEEFRLKYKLPQPKQEDDE